VAPDAGGEPPPSSLGRRTYAGSTLPTVDGVGLGWTGVAVGVDVTVGVAVPPDPTYGGATGAAVRVAVGATVAVLVAVAVGVLVTDGVAVTVGAGEVGERAGPVAVAE
jgi:hypothetical protein